MICRYKFLVVDDEHILDIHNLRRRVNEATKHPESVIQLDAPWHRENELFNYANVLFDEEESLFKMWYCVMSYEGQLADGARKLAYATSTDGLHWERPRLGLVQINGSKENNYIVPEMRSFVAAIIKDPSDIPVRRYKMVFSTSGRETAWAGFHSPLGIAYSHDGLTWERPQHVNPVLRGVGDDCVTFFYDADRRKYVLLTRRVPNLPRDISQYESYDLVNWEDRGRVLVPADEHDPPEMFNFYYMSPFRYEDLYLGMLNAMHTHPISESYESFHRSAGYPDDKLGHLDIQLAFSRDGRTWRRPVDRSPVIPFGPPGFPDSGAIYPAMNPVVRDGETWIYYTATRHLHSWWHVLEEYHRDPDMRKVACGMLAKMPEDHWVSLDAGDAEHWFRTKPWGPPHEVFVNADVGKDGYVTVELVTPYGEPMAGYSRAECVPVTASGKGQPVRWRNGKPPHDFIGDYLGGVCARFTLKNAKLYSYTFTLPDPDGQLERNRLSARWLDVIKHRSDSRDRFSTEPAVGLLPFGCRLGGG